MNSPFRRLNVGASQHLPYPLIGLNLLWCLRRRRSDLAFLSSSPSYEIQIFSYSSIWFPHWLESEDYARPRFYPRALVLNRAWAVSWLGPKLGGISVFSGHAILFGCPDIRGAPSRDSFIFRAADDVGNRASDILSVAFLGTLRELNDTILSFDINRRESCFSYAQILQLPPLGNHVWGEG